MKTPKAKIHVLPNLKASQMPTRSDVATLAAKKAHTHKSFQDDRNATERKEATANYREALAAFIRKFPAYARARKLAA